MTETTDILSDYDRQIQDLSEQLEIAKRQKQVYEIEKEARDLRRSMRKRISTTKLIVLFLFLNCTAVEAYSMLVMWLFADLSALYALITAVVTETISFAVYALKAYHETKQEKRNELEYREFMIAHGEEEEVQG